MIDNFPIPLMPAALRAAFLRWSVFWKTLLITTMLAALPQSLPAQAESETVVLPELLVTAQKREQLGREVPIALSVLGSQDLAELRIQDMAQLSAYIPNFEVQLQSPNNPGFAIRGITSDSGDAFVEPRVSIFQDGVSISKSRGSAVELFDLARVEVLKGPQSTLFGRAASTGALHLISARPEDKEAAHLRLGMGNHGQLLAEGMVNAVLLDQRLFLRLAGIWRKHDGFVQNLAGGDLNGAESFAVRPSLRFLPGPATTIDLIYNYQKDDYPGTAFKQAVYAPRGGDTSPFSAAELNRGQELGIERTLHSLTLDLEHRFGDALSLSAISGYRHFESNEEFDADGSQAYFAEFGEEADGEQISQELRLNLTLGERFEGFAGSTWFKSSARTRVPLRADERSLMTWLDGQLAATFNDDIQMLNATLASLGAPLTVPLIPDLPLIDSNGDPVLSHQTLPYGLVAAGAAAEILPLLLAGQIDLATALGLFPTPDQAPALKPYHFERYTNWGDTEAFDFFIDGTFELTSRLSLTGGLRYSMETIETRYRMDPADSPSALSALTLGASGLTPDGNVFFPVTAGTLSREEDYASTVGRLLLSFDLNATSTLYTGVTRGRRPPVISVDQTSQELQALQPETLWNYEAGFKGLALDGRLGFDFAAFMYAYKNFSTTIVENLQRRTIDAGNASAFGFEASLQAILFPGFTAFANYGFIDATFDDTDDSGNPQLFAGNQFRLTPRHSFAAGFTYLRSINQFNLFLTPSVTWKSRVYFENDNRPDLSQDAYALVNLRAGLRKGAWELAFFVSNLSDEEYLIDAGNTGDNFDLPTFVAGSPRLYGIELSWNY